MVFVDIGFDDRIDRTAFFAKTTVDALEQIDVVTRGAACAVLALLGIDRDRERRTHRFAQLAGDAAFFAVRVTPQCMQAAETIRLRNFFHRITHRVLGFEHIFHGQAQTTEQLDQQQAFEVVGDAIHEIPSGRTAPT